MRRVVITGLGIISCLGNNQEEVHQSLLNSKSGISYSEEYKEHNLKSHIHGKPNIKIEDQLIFVVVACSLYSNTVGFFPFLESNTYSSTSATVQTNKQTKEYS